jgi:glycosyltransferase involved in cell wall biosynthesis
MSAPVWHLLTGEYPPHGGGIADYTALLARALADAGRDVHVWTPARVEPSGDSSVTVHAMDGFSGAALRRLDAELGRFPAPRRLLVQYAPQAWGMRGMNVPFCRWVLSRRHAGDDVRVMFHEPFFPFGWQRPQRNLLAAVNRWMARLLLRASTRAYVSISAWEALLRPLAPPGLEFTVLPIPSTIPFVDDPPRVAALRRELSEDGRRPIFVHFGTYGGMLAPMLLEGFASLVASCPHACILLLGARGPAFAERLRRADANFSQAVVAAPGRLSAEEVSLHLQAASVAVQPYPDGADTRRTSLMACLANGVPTVTTRGRFTGILLSQAPVARYLPAVPEQLASLAMELMTNPAAASAAARNDAALRRETRAYYRHHFAVEHTVARLLADEGGG